MTIFRFFQDSGPPPSWICYVCIRTTLEGRLVVFIAMQNLVGIDAVLIICMLCFSISRVWLENAYSRPQNWGFWGFYPLSGEQCQRSPKKAHPCASPRCLSHQKSVDASDLQLISRKKGINKNYLGYNTNYFTHWPRSRKGGCASNLHSGRGR